MPGAKHNDGSRTTSNTSTLLEKTMKPTFFLSQRWKPDQVLFLEWLMTQDNYLQGDELKVFHHIHQQVASRQIEDVMRFYQSKASPYSNPPERKGTWLDDRKFSSPDKNNTHAQCSRKYGPSMTAAKLISTKSER